jgi:lipoprotein-anchoring transpeptidase ErfK/SrfK
MHAVYNVIWKEDLQPGTWKILRKESWPILTWHPTIEMLREAPKEVRVAADRAEMETQNLPIKK